MQYKKTPPKKQQKNSPPKKQCVRNSKSQQRSHGTTPLCEYQVLLNVCALQKNNLLTTRNKINENIYLEVSRRIAKQAFDINLLETAIAPELLCLVFQSPSYSKDFVPLKSFWESPSSSEASSITLRPPPIRRGALLKDGSFPRLKGHRETCTHEEDTQTYGHIESSDAVSWLGVV